jgi:hypothetical protein
LAQLKLASRVIVDTGGVRLISLSPNQPFVK